MTAHRGHLPVGRASAPSVLSVPSVLSAAVLALLLVLSGAGQAGATGYRYWSFWERDGSQWTYASLGPSVARPSDGDVQGFRFTVGDEQAKTAGPRGTADFDAICGKTPAREDRKRVALVLDFGTEAEAPGGETPPRPRTACASVAEDATTADALASVAKPLRYDSNALLCAIAGYPAKGCAEAVSGEGEGSGKDGDATAQGGDGSGKPAAQESADEDGGPSVGLFAGAGLVVLLGAAAWWQTRRRRS